MSEASAISKPCWSKEQIENLLKTEAFGFQRIELGYGLATPGRDRSVTARLIFPERLDGKSVIDIGCNHGFFLFEAAKRGAQRVVGMDADPAFIRRARLLNECLGLDVRFEVRDIERQPLDESFDYVLSLNLLHHLRNPLSALDNFIAKTNERLVLEMATVGRHDRPKLGLSLWAARALARLPVIYVGKDDQRAKRQVQKFFFTPSAIENLLIHQRGVFARAEIVPSEHKGGRFICLADKRKIGHLLFVAGPTAVGKRSFVEALRAGRLPEVAQRIGIDPAAGWDDVLLAERMHAPGEPRHERLIFLFDFLRPDLHRPKVNPRDIALDILKTAEKITFVTLWAPHTQLGRQLATVAKERATSKRLRKRYQMVAEEYEKSAAVTAHYREWNTLVSTYSNDHFIVCNDERPAVALSVGEWERRLGGA